MDPLQRVILREPDGGDVGDSAIEGEAVIGGEVRSSLHGGDGAEAIAVAKKMIPMGDPLIVVIAAVVGGGDIVGGESGNVRLRIQRQNGLPDRADAAGWNLIARELRAYIGAEARHSPKGVDADHARVRGKRIVDAKVVAGELSGAQIGRRGVEHSGIRDNLPEAFVAEEDPVLVFLDRSAERRSELIGAVVPLGRADSIVLGCVGVKDGVVEILEQLPVPLIRARLERSDDRAAAGPPELRIVSVDHDLKLLDRVDARRKEPSAGDAHRRAVHEELVGSLSPAVNDEFAVRIPAAQARESARSELLLSENDAWRETDQRVGLSSNERQVAQLLGIQSFGSRSGGGFDGLAVGGDGDSILDVADFEDEREIARFVRIEQDAALFERTESDGHSGDAVAARAEEGEGKLSTLVGEGFGGLIGFGADDTDLGGGNGSAGRIDGVSYDAGAEGLGVQGRGGAEHHERSRQRAAR